LLQKHIEKNRIMSTKKTGNFILSIIGAAYLVFAIVPLIKSILAFKNYSSNKEQWVEEPLLIDE